jgi:spermidine synthase
VSARQVIPAYVDYLYTNDRFREIRQLIETADVAANTDRRPLCYQYTQLLWLSRFHTGAARLEITADSWPGLWRSAAWWLTLTAALAVLLLARRRIMLRRALLALLAGLVGMLLESVLILGYQVHHGVLYQDLGLLITAFMAGLLVGATAVDRLAVRSAGAGMDARGRGAAIGSALAALALLVAILPGLPGRAGGLAATALLLLATGALTAALFAYAALARSPDREEVVAPLYSADLLGGAIGSLAASLLLVPLLGLGGTALVAAALALLWGLLLV